MVTAAGPLNKLLSLPTFKFLPSSSLSLLRMSFASTDPFANEGDPLASSQDVGSQSHHLHIRIQQRNGRKTLTTLQGLQKEYNHKKLLQAFKKDFACNGTIINDETMGTVIQLQGDQRTNVSNFLVDHGIERSSIKIHGF